MVIFLQFSKKGKREGKEMEWLIFFLGLLIIALAILCVKYGG